MVTHENGVFYFTGNDSKRLQRELDHPNLEALHRRRAFMREAAESEKDSIRLPDGSILVHVTIKDNEHGF